MRLRAYQKRALKEAEGMQRVVFVAPMGAGKGTMAAHMIAEAVKRGQRVLFIVHLRDIADDMAERVMSYRVKTSMVFPPYDDMDANAQVQIATIQSLPGKKIGSFGLVIVDEAHHYRADEWEKLTMSVSKGARFVGFTATPQRADGKGLGSVFERMVNVVTYRELLDCGHIVPCLLKVPPYRMDGKTAMEPAEAYLEHARGKSAIVFVRNLKTAGGVRQKLRDAGITAEIITDKTKHDDRARFIEQLRNGKTKVIVNYGTMTEGIDVPRVSCIVLEQACRNAGSYLQRVGRGLRPFDGKMSMLLLDLSGASYRHGVPTSDRREYNLSDKPITIACGLEIVRRSPTRAVANVVGVGLVDADEEWLAANGGPRVVDAGAIAWSSSDRVIASEVGVSSFTLGRMRRSAGVISWKERRRLAIVNDPRIGLIPDEILAKEHGCSMCTVASARKGKGLADPVTVHRKSMINNAIDLVRKGTPASVAAKQCGVDYQTALRKALVTSGFVRVGRGSQTRWVLGEAGVVPIDWASQPLDIGQAELARMLGVSRSAVYAARRKLAHDQQNSKRQ